MICMLFDGLGRMSVWLSMGAPSIHNMSRLSQAMHVHVLGRHAHCDNHFWDCDVLGPVILVANIY